MKKLLSILLLLGVIGCVPKPIPVPDPPKARHVKAAFIAAGEWAKNPTYQLEVDPPFGDQPCTYADGQLDCILGEKVGAPYGAHLRFTVDGFHPYTQDFVLSGEQNQFVPEADNPPNIGNPKPQILEPLPPPHFDPMSLSLEELAKIRGAMWTEELNVPLGPRPNQPNNIAATDFLWNYDDATKERILANLIEKGYTHVVNGPIVDSDGYHGAWSPNDWRGENFNRFLDMLEFEWDHKLIPVVFLKPDNWTFEQLAQLTQMFQSERAQRLIRIVVPAGWEPTRYEWSNATWIRFMKWGRETFPNAIVGIHTVCDVDAPVGTDSLGDDNNHLSNADAWRRITPYLHFWLTQSCTYERKDGVADNGKTNYQNWVDLFNPNIRGSYQDRFQHGYAGWPTFSAWGNKPMKVIAGEYLSYWVFWHGASPAEARKWGDAALCAGADGYLDGGTGACH
jgi:hypothetical protein